MTASTRKPSHGGYPGFLLPRHQPIHGRAAASWKWDPPLPSKLGDRHDKWPRPDYRGLPL